MCQILTITLIVSCIVIAHRVLAKYTEKADNEDALLKELEAALQDDDKKGPKIQKQLSDIALKRWGKRLNADKVTSIYTFQTRRAGKLLGIKHSTCKPQNMGAT